MSRSIEQVYRTANAFLPQFIDDYNRRFTHRAQAPAGTSSVPALNPDNVHRAVLHDKAVRRAHRAEELKLIISLHHQRKLSKNLTIQFRHTEYQLTGYGKGFSLRGATITICQDFNGSVTEATQRQC